jgi:hypothetical protein
MAKAVSVPAAALLVLLACCSCCGVRGEVAREVRVSLVNFLTVLAGGDGGQAVRKLQWNAAVDPCTAGSKDSRWGGHLLRQPQRVRRPRQEDRVGVDLQIGLATRDQVQLPVLIEGNPRNQGAVGPVVSGYIMGT